MIVPLLLILWLIIELVCAPVRPNDDDNFSHRQ